MGTTRDEISSWFDMGVKEGATHMVIVCDTFDWEDYPVFCKSGEEAREKFDSPGSMQKSMECYNLTMSKASQLDERRAYNF